MSAPVQDSGLVPEFFLFLDKFDWLEHFFREFRCRFACGYLRDPGSVSYVDLHMIVRPVLSEFTGNNRLEMIRGAATLMDDYDKKSPVRRFIRAIA